MITILIIAVCLVVWFAPPVIVGIFAGLIPFILVFILSITDGQEKIEKDKDGNIIIDHNTITKS